MPPSAIIPQAQTPTCLSASRPLIVRLYPGKEKTKYPMKRPYEITVVVRILANEEETLNTLNQVTSWIEQANDAGEAQGKVTRLDRTSLGRRKLAYEIDKQRDGVFVIYYADVEPDHIKELELNLKLSQSILRHLVVRLDEAKETTTEKDVKETTTEKEPQATTE
jgi:small subunit ribosomal protein S6